MKSACEALLYRTFLETWRRGEKYANEGRVKIFNSSDKRVLAKVAGAQIYEVVLEFRTGGLSRKCSCPVKDLCKHMVAVAIVWDESLGIPRPAANNVEQTAIPPPLVSRADINRAYNDPLSADLEILRLAGDEMGSWSRPHARLPNIPRFNTELTRPLSLKEIKLVFSEINQWTRRSKFDPYFCAGETVAAFCEVLRIVKQRLLSTAPEIAVEILLGAQRFHYKIILEFIDDSDGLHIFNEAHLDDIYKYLKQHCPSGRARQLLEEFDRHRDDY